MPRNVRSASRAALVESHLAGVTTSLDMYFFCDSVLEAADEVGARVLTGPVLLDRAGPDGSDGPWQNRLDGAADWLTGHVSRSDWSPVLGPHSTYTVSPDHLLAAGQLARDSGALLHLHAAETEAEINTVLDAHGRRPVELLDHLELLGPRTILAHGVHLTRGEMDRLAETGTRVVHCPGSNLKLASGIAPVRSLLRDGVAVALGTDGAASSNHLDVLAIMRLTALVHKTCAPEGADAASLPAAQALAMGTRSGAEVLGLGDRLGVLRPGASADLVAIDLARVHTQPVQDVCSAMVYTADRGDVTDVWSDGRRVVRAGVHQLVSEAEVVADLRDLGEIAAGWG